MARIIMKTANIVTITAILASFLSEMSNKIIHSTYTIKRKLTFSW